MNCPTCNSPVARENNQARPFCSERCKLIDFGRWADEDYRIPDESSAAPTDFDEEDLRAIEAAAQQQPRRGAAQGRDGRDPA